MSSLSKYSVQPGEIINIHIGEAGIRIGSACWELFCLEHGVGPDGAYNPDKFANEAIFSIMSDEKVVPRSLMIDYHPVSISQVRTGPYGELFEPTGLLYMKEGSASNFAKAYFTMSPVFIDLIMDRIQEMVEKCEKFQGFIVYSALSGGTGSGLGTLLIEKLRDQYFKATIIAFTIVPSTHVSTVIVEPYNSLLATHLQMDESDCSLLFDNEKLHHIFKKKLEVPRFGYDGLNHLLAQVVSNLTAEMRFDGPKSHVFSDLYDHLVPYERIGYAITTLSPLSNMPNELTTRQLTFAAFDPENTLLACNPLKGLYTSCILMYRGHIVNRELTRAIDELKRTRKVPLARWSPAGFKLALCRQPQSNIANRGFAFGNKTVTCISNNSSIKEVWERLLRRYEALVERRAFFHHYLSEGLDEGTFEDVYENISALIDDYKAIED